MTAKEQIKNLIMLMEDFQKFERERKNAHADRISTHKTSREICETASIRIKCYDDFINHLKGINNTATDL